MPQPLPITTLADLKKAKHQYKVASLFCGAGGMDIGFELEGFQTVWANDANRDACATHQSWSTATVVHDNVKDIDPQTIPDVDLIIGGFPCPGFSLAGPRKIDDSRNALYRYFVSCVKAKQPRMFIAENVKGLMRMGGGEILEAIIADFQEQGYTVTYKLLNASQYGVPQDRERVILVGIRNGIDTTFTFPKPLETSVSLKDIIGGMKAKKSDICDAPYSPRYMSRNRKRGWDEVSFTIPAMAKQVPLHPSSPNMIKVGPDHWKFGTGTTRRVSWQEAAAIQTFPADLVFAGNLTSKYKQIGNAVPVNLARAVAAEAFRSLN